MIVRTDVKVVSVLLGWKFPTFLDLAMPPVVCAIVVDSRCAHGSVFKQDLDDRGKREDRKTSLWALQVCGDPDATLRNEVGGG